MAVEIYRTTYCDEIQSALEDLLRRLEINAKAGRTDLHRDAENIMLSVLEPTYGLRLRNANIEVSNADAFDLIDTTQRVIIQVSTDDSRGKIQSTLCKEKLAEYEGYDLWFMFLVTKHRKYTSKEFDIPDGLVFNPSSNVIDVGTLMARIRNLKMKRIEQIRERIRREIGMEQRGVTNYAAFYEYVYKRFSSDTGNELYGKVPLRDFYIEPTVDVKDADGNYQSVREHIESWVDGDGRIAVICGEPGHGKTTLCQKAMCDFYKGGWLAGKVKNVFRFSLNPANTDALSSGYPYIYSFLSWGDDRRNPNKRMQAEDCNGALVFFDGFDELLEWCPGLSLGTFIGQYVEGFQRETNAHVIITSRTMAVDRDKDSCERIEKTMGVPIVRLQLTTRESQIAWIEKYIDHHRRMLSDDAKQEAEELNDYLLKYKNLGDDSDLQSILGIPIIFRMIVANHYLPEEGKSIAQKYDELFNATWIRHVHGKKDSLEKAKERLSQHALRVFMDNNDTAKVGGHLKSSWVFSFYTTHEGGKRVGFLHRSFYQYFLAHEILSWFRQCAEDKDPKALRGHFSSLARRRLDMTTLRYIQELYIANGAKESFGNSFNVAYGILKKTDGILPLPSDDAGAEIAKTVIPLERANNVFWNVVSICSICGYEVSAQKVNVRVLQLYDLERCVLMHARLEGAYLRQAYLSGADLRGADLRGADLTGADLRWAHLRMEDLEGAIYEKSDLEGAILE